MRAGLAALVAAAAFPAAAGAVTVEPCGDFRSQIAAVAEPWTLNTTTYANGEVRLVVTDTIEPAAGAFHLVILSPPYDEVGGRTCAVVSADGGLGFSGIDLGSAAASYDPARGLSVTMGVGLYDGETADFLDAALTVTVNQSTGDVTAAVQ